MDVVTLDLQFLQVPLIMIRAIVTSVGSGCSTLLSVNTPTVKWAVYLISHRLRDWYEGAAPLHSASSNSRVSVMDPDGMVRLIMVWEKRSSGRKS